MTARSEHAQKSTITRHVYTLPDLGEVSPRLLHVIHHVTLYPALDRHEGRNRKSKVIALNKQPTELQRVGTTQF